MHQLKINFDGNNDAVRYRSLNDYKLNEFDGESGTTVQPVLNDYLQFSFTGNRKIKSHEDVAHLMAILESKSAEHFFVVHVNKEKDPLIQYVGVGARNFVLVDRLNIHAVANYHNTKDLYLIHNHPSGTLAPSSADIKLTQKFLDSYGMLNIDVNHIIINTYKKEYVMIDTDLNSVTYSRPLDSGNCKHQAVLLQDMDFLREPIGKVTSSREAFQLIQQFRFSALPKFGLMVLSASNEVVANFLVDNLDIKTVAKAVASVPNGTQVIAYGNQESPLVKNIKDKLEKFDIPLLDYIQFDSDGVGVKDAYKSCADEGILHDIQERYQTNSVNTGFQNGYSIKR